MKAALYAAVLGAFALSAPAHAQTSGTTGSGGQGASSTETTGTLPEGSLAQKRQGAIDGGDVKQDDNRAAEAEGTATGQLPQNSLPAQRQGAIGDSPAPVTQGGGEGSKQ